jgi:hypothetical protein
MEMILAALGVMADELSRPVPVNEIGFCIRVDFKKKLDDMQINKILLDAEKRHYCQRNGISWELTPEGGKICDDYLNSHGK